MTDTTPRAIRIPDDLWAAALNKATEREETVSEVVREALERYIKR
jgi:predicted DNA-binding protein